MWKCLREVAASAVVVTALAACGGDAASGGGGSEGPIRVAYLSILQGPNAIEGSDRAMNLAVEEVNAAGGISGHKIELKTYNTDITPAGAVTATNLALKDNPHVIIGYGVSAGLKASIPAINQAGIPVLHSTLASITGPKSLNSQLTFRISPTTEMYAQASTQYLFDNLGVKRMLMLHTSDAAPTEGADSIAKLAAGRSVQLAKRSVPPTVTDLTEAVLAARDTDAAWVWGYSQTDGLFLKQMKQNGVDKPVMTFSANAAARTGLIPAEQLTEKVSYVSACAADTLQTAKATQYRDAFAKKYGPGLVEPFGPVFYDAVYILKAAVEKAGSNKPKDIATALETLEYQGICGDFKADSNHNMIHNVPVVNFPGGKAVVAKNYTGLTSSF
jgi:branched-chain amino acid transport system substrate-binding protein